MWSWDEQHVAYKCFSDVSREDLFIEQKLYPHHVASYKEIFS
jgi:hypothetical protein